MFPTLIDKDLFGLEIRSFGLMAATGLLLAFWLVQVRSKKAGEDPQALSDIIFFGMIGALIGARLLYVVRNWDAEFAHDLWKIVRINEGGIVFQGGFIGGLLIGWYMCRRKKVDFIKALDIIAPCLALGHAMGRIGCFLNGCCYGGLCKTGWAVEFPAKSLPYVHHQRVHQLSPFAEHSLPVHPTQIYSFAANLLICFALIFVTAKLKVKGQLFSLYLMLYGIWRLSIEFLRDDQARHLGLSVAQYIAIGQFAVGLALWVYFTNKYKKNNEIENASTAS
jgi:phosphatidylglycerol---prolipoprotein diacylglyceryl transferase